MLLFTLLPRWQRLLLALLLALALTSLLCARPAQAQLSLVGARAPLGPVVTTPYVQAELVAHAPQGVAAGQPLWLGCYAELGRAQAALAEGASYVAFGAMYPSPTKPQASRASLELLRRARAELAVPIAVIGGITLERADELVAAGADWLAVISDLFAAPDPLERALAWAAWHNRVFGTEGKER